MYLLEIVWDVNKNVFPNWSASPAWYGLAWSFSIFAAYFVGLKVFAIDKQPEHKVIALVGFNLFMGVIGARLGQIIFYEWDFYSANPTEMLKIWKGGLASHGGVLLTILGLIAFAKYQKISYLKILDYSALMGMPGAALVRLGNLFNSELYGTVTSKPWGFVFLNNNHLSNIGDISPRHPVVLYEAIMIFIIFILLFSLFKRLKGKFVGLIFGLFCALIWSLRLLLEFFKVQDLESYRTVLGMPVGKTQLLSIPVIILGLVIVYFAYNRKAAI